MSTVFESKPQGGQSVADISSKLEFQKQRCQGLASMAAESARIPAPGRPAEEPPGRTPTRAVRSGYFVQVSAVRMQAAANTEIARIKRAGYTAVVVRESGLLKVRAGLGLAAGELDPLGEILVDSRTQGL